MSLALKVAIKKASVNSDSTINNRLVQVTAYADVAVIISRNKGSLQSLTQELDKAQEGWGLKAIAPVSYTHLDVYKRQIK